jgi:hypothetical protein
MAPKELADKQSEIIFEDGKVLFIKVKGYDAMDYYASERLKGNIINSTDMVIYT